jgi:hypothetical protein
MNFLQILRSALARSSERFSVRHSDHSCHSAGKLGMSNGGTRRKMEVERLRTTVGPSGPQSVMRPVQEEGQSMRMDGLLGNERLERPHGLEVVIC